MSKKIVIIGGGPAGYEAALHGASLGGEITLIEGHKIGGTCLNYGCIPTKTLIEHASFYNKAVQNDYMGVHIGDITLDYDRVLEHKSQVVESLVTGINAKLKKAKVTILDGWGSLSPGGQVHVQLKDGSEVFCEADAIVMATGSKPFMPNFPGIDSGLVMTSKDLLALEVLPESLTIVGGGVIGMEFGVLLSDFGVQITILEYAKTILPNLDSAISKRLKSVVTKKGIKVITSAKVTGFEEVDGRVQTFYEDKKGEQFIQSDYALMAIGRVGQFDPNNLNAHGVTHNERFIEVNDHYRTSLEMVYAIGDVNGRSLLAHAAYDQARQLMAHLIKGQTIKEKLIPGCVFTHPEIGSVGLSEDTAKASDIDFTSQKSLFSANGKAMSMGETTGFIKTLSDEEGRLIGCHMMGPHASDIIHYASIAMAGDMTVHQLKDIIFAHPTLGELFNDNMWQF